MKDKLNRNRLKDFQSRTTFSPSSVYLHRTRKWKYIPIHPFADELELLSRLKMQPDDCQSADAWWSVEEDATLLEVWTTKVSNRPQGLYARQTDHKSGWIYLTAITNLPSISRTTFELTMEYFSELGFPAAECFRLNSEKGLVRVGNFIS
jgi:hypothetical protein